MMMILYMYGISRRLLLSEEIQLLIEYVWFGTEVYCHFLGTEQSHDFSHLTLFIIILMSLQYGTFSNFVGANN